MKQLLLVLLAASLLFAEEGMWLLNQLENLNLEQKGLDITATDIWNPQDGGISQAVISLGGCTASFVSGNGLIITNHHCAYGALNRNSTVDNNILKNGFLAASEKEELPTFGTNVYVLDSFEDVTDKVLKGTKRKSGKARKEKIEENSKKIVQKAEKENPNIQARVASMYGGQTYILFIHLKIKDVRLVYAPPEAVGKFGGDIDNFEWPRHTGDYAFLRAYVGPDGKPAEPSKDNVPYQPEKWLSISIDKGFAKGDLNMVIGYPGRTSRYLTSHAIDYYQNTHYPWRIDMLTRAIDLIEDYWQDDKEAQVKLASLHSSLNNSLKNSQGQQDGFIRTDVYNLKVAQEKEFLKKLQNDTNLQKEYDDILPAIESLYQERGDYYPALYWFNWLGYVNGIVDAAETALEWDEQKRKPEIKRAAGYRDKDIENKKKRWEYSQRTFVAEFDKKMMALFFQLAHELPENQKIATIEKISQGLTGQAQKEADWEFINKLYADTKLTTVEAKINALEQSQAELLSSNDPAFQFIFNLMQEIDPLDEKNKAFDGALLGLRPQYIQAITQDKLVYPDANSTKRLTYGYVQGYSPRDAVEYDHFTTVNGIVEKYTGNEPFESPQKQLDLIAQKQFGEFVDPVTKTLNVNLLNTLDTTGGNSGSPVLNARGELIGLLFDGNYESIVADYAFDKSMTRSICVDIRYVLWYMKYVDSAHNLLKEMGL